MKKCILLLFGTLISFLSFAQSIITTHGTYPDNNTSSAISFEVESSSIIEITGISNVFNATTTSSQVWVRVGGIASAPLNSSGNLEVTAANGWVLNQTCAVSGGGGINSVPVALQGFLPILVAANTPVGIVITGSMRYSGTASPVSPTAFTNGPVTLRTGGVTGTAIYGFGGALPAALVNKPRGFIGTLTYGFVGPCINPPVAGTAAASPSTVCIGGNVDLSATGLTSGTGQTYQWQSSPDDVTWTNIPGKTGFIASVNPTANTYYRLAVTCGVTSFSASTLVVTQGTTLSGTYTINKNQPTSGTNFQSFTDLANVLVCASVSGNVTVNVAPNTGPYKERFVLGTINGVGPNARLIINGNGNELRDSSNVSADRAAVLLDGTDYLTLDSLQISCKGTYGWAVQLTNAANNNIIKNCRLETSVTSTTSNHSGIVLNGSFTSATTSGNTGNYNRFENNVISGGYYGIISAANTTNRNVGNTFMNNKVRDFYFYGIYHSGQDSLIVTKNNITRPTRANFGSTYGIYTSNCGHKSEISYNWIHNLFAQGSSTTGLMYGIQNNASDNVVGKESMVYNNLIENNINNGIHYLIYNAGSDGWKYYHNTLVYDGPNSQGSTRGFYQTTAATGIEFKNNLVYINRGGTSTNYAIYAGTSTSVMDVDHNAYYVVGGGTGTNHYGYFTSNQSSFTDWQTASGLDAASKVGQPFFAPNSNYKPTAATVNNIGANLLAIVPDDIDGNARTITPDPGVYEYMPSVGPDMRVASIAQSGLPCSVISSADVTVQNIGSDTVYTFDIHWKINGISQTPITVSDTFYTGRSKAYTLSPIPVKGNTSSLVEVTLVNVAPGVDLNLANNSGSGILRNGFSGQLAVNPSATANDTVFLSFSDLSLALMSRGVCGPVTVNVQPGAPVFNEQFILGEIPGASAANRITVSGNGNTLEYLSSVSGQRGTIILNGTDYLTIDSLNVKALGRLSGQYGFGIQLYNNANHNIFSRNVVSAADSSTSTNFAGIALSNSATSATTTGNSGSYNKFIGNTISGGYYGLAITGSSTAGVKGNVAEKNKVTGFYLYGIYLNQPDSAMVIDNEVTRPTRVQVSTFYGVYVTGAGNHNRIVGNRIHNSFGGNRASTSVANGIYLTGMNAVAGKSNVVANNLVYNMNGSGSIYGIYISAGNYTKVLHNTVAIIDLMATPGATTFTRGIYLTGSPQNLEVKNNLVTVNRSGTTNTHLIYMNTVASQADVDYNAYYRTGNNSFGYYGANVASLSQWKSISGKDANSVSSNPFFVNAAGFNFTPQAASFDGIALNVNSEVPVDFNKVVRSANSDPGAFEFTGAPCTGLSGITITPAATTAQISWSPSASGVTVEWGPANFKQASITGTTVVLGSTATTTTLSGLGGNRCYDIYLTQNCTSTIPGAPQVLGPFTFCTACVGGGLAAGTYTIGGAAGTNNFKDVDSAIVTLNGCGIAGPVIFNVRPGVYTVTEPLLSVTGASATNTITFDGMAGPGDTVRSSGSAVFNMNGSSHFIFKGLTVVNTSGRGFWLQNGADSNAIEDCKIYLNEAATTAASGGIVSSASATALTAGADVDGMIVRNNFISGGYHGIASYGNTATSKVKGWVIEGNTLSNQYYYGVYSNYNDGVVIRKNSIKGLRNTTSHGIYLLNTDNFDIEANTIHDAKTYGVYVSTANGGLTTPPAVRSRFVNNMVAVPASGAYFTSVNHVDVFHNSIEGTYGFRLFTPTFMSIRNNIFVGISNYAFESGTALVAPNQVNYNLYHKRGGTNLIKDGTPTYANLALWQTAVAAQNTNSIEGDPLFRSTTDLHATGTIANDVGDNTVGVNVDIDNDVRPASGSTVVDMGADEYTPLSIDIAVISLNTTPGDGTCGDSLTQIEVTVVNRGISSITSIPVNVTVNGAISTTFSSTIAGPLAPLASTVINVGPLNTAGGGSFLITAYSSLTTDQDNGNDTISGAFAYKSVQAPQITAFLDSFCTGSFDTLYAPKGSGDKFEWRDINGGFISNGEKLTVGPLGTTDTTFLLATTSQQYSVGPLNNSIGTAGNFTDPSVQQIHFTALQSFTLDSVTVYPNGNGNVNINLLDFTSNTVLQTITVPVTGVVAPGTAIRIAVGMVIPPGTYKMHGGGSTTGGLWRNSTGAVHPYTLPGVVSITGNSFGAAYFYYFYNWKVSALSCIRPEGRITLYAGAAGIVPSFTSMQQSPTTTSMQIDFNATASVGGTSYSWDFGDGNVGSGIATSHVYSANGTYQVVLTVTSSCGSKTITKTIVVAGIGMDENPLNNSLIIYPNPTSSQLTVSFTRAANSTVRIRIIDMAGKEVLKLNVDGSGNQLFEEKLNTSELNDGIYLLEITDGSFSVKRRVVKN